jgi:hypothetical protein
VIGFRRLVLPVLAAAALLVANRFWASPAASARAPSVPDQASLDWVLQRLSKDREAEKSAAGKEDVITLYETGKTPLDQWADLVRIIKDTTPGRTTEKDRAVRAIAKRFETEDAARRLDMRAIWNEKRKVCEATLDMMLREDQVNRTFVLTLQQRLLPAERVTWNPVDSKMKIKAEYEKLKKWLALK